MDDEVFKFYEKLYFHEIEAREKISSRLQTPMTLIIALVGVLAFLLQNSEYHGNSCISRIFWFLVVVAALSTSASIIFFIRSWFNNTYYFVPSAQEIEEYRQKISSLYSTYANKDDLIRNAFSQYLLKSYIDSSSYNTWCNDDRSISLNRANLFIIITAIFSVLAFLVFFFGKLDKVYNQKPTKISIVNPVKVIGGNMQNNTSEGRQNDAPPPTQQLPPVSQIIPTPPPTPPPGPPLRQIKEGVTVINPAPSGNRSPK